MAQKLQQLTTSLGPMIDKFDNYATVIGKREDPRLPIGNSKRDPSSIHFDIEHGPNEAKVYQYDDQLERDLSGRGIVFDEDATTLEKQILLRDSLVQEWTFRQLTLDVSHGQLINGQANCAYYVLDSVPCILHAENRMGLKILELLLNEGLNTCEKFPRFLEKWPNSPKHCREAYVEEITRDINTVCLGTVERETQWECPTDADIKK